MTRVMKLEIISKYPVEGPNLNSPSALGAEAPTR